MKNKIERLIAALVGEPIERRTAENANLLPVDEINTEMPEWVQEYRYA